MDSSVQLPVERADPDALTHTELASVATGARVYKGEYIYAIVENALHRIHVRGEGR